MLIQFIDDERAVRAGLLDDDGAAVRVIDIDHGIYALAMEAATTNTCIADIVASRVLETKFDFAQLEANGRLLAPATHPDSARCLLTGTGLTHTASAAARDGMHAAAASGAETDSMRIYRAGEAGGKPPAGAVGALPEWFYKGDGQSLRGPGEDLPRPVYAKDAGEEAEIAGVYVIGPDGTPARIGFVLANECSDHKIERENYLYLAHSKLRCAAIGPELLVGELPDSFGGTVRILRGDDVIWSSDYRSGAANMCHSLENLEHHHFKYPQFRRPGDLHIHFLGAACVSCNDGIETQHGDVIEISAEPFNHPLSNAIAADGGEEMLVAPRRL